MSLYLFSFCVSNVDNSYYLAINDRSPTVFMSTDVDSRPGMFLWVHLVPSSLEHACSIHELGAAVNEFPNELAGVLTEY